VREMWTMCVESEQSRNKFGIVHIVHIPPPHSSFFTRRLDFQSPQAYLCASRKARCYLR
jgi:hypothetical protein